MNSFFMIGEENIKLQEAMETKKKAIDEASQQARDSEK